MVTVAEGLVGSVGLTDANAAQLMKELWILKGWRSIRYMNLRLSEARHSTEHVKCPCCRYDFLANRTLTSPAELVKVSVAFMPGENAVEQLKLDGKIGKHYYVCPKCEFFLWSHMWKMSLMPLVRLHGSGIVYVESGPPNLRAA